MFDVYMQGQGVDPRTRARMMMALVAAMGVTVSAAAASWAVGKMSVRRVGAPNPLAVIELAMAVDLPQSQAEPPPRPEPVEPAAAATSPAATGASQPAPDEAPTETPSELPSPRTQPASTPEGGEGVPGVPGVPGLGGPGCLGAGCVPGGPPRPPRRVGVFTPRQTETDTTVREPLSSIRVRSLYTPDPKTADLAKTKTGLGARRPGTVEVEFCVGPNGRVANAKVVHGFSGDPGIDRVCKNAVKSWRFKPAQLNGKARTVCSEVSFEIRFDG